MDPLLARPLAAFAIECVLILAGLLLDLPLALLDRIHPR
jgi:hypothetical protein